MAGFTPSEIFSLSASGAVENRRRAFESNQWLRLSTRKKEYSATLIGSGVALGMVPGRLGMAARTYVTGVPAAAVRPAYRAVSWPVTGPGWPSPMGRPSTDSTGTRPPMVPVTNASSAV